MATQVSLTDGAVASAGALAIQTNGTTQAVSISTGQVATLAQNPILTSGTANGVAYLNGSKAVTSGSALTFDGTNFATTGTASATKMIPTGGSATGNGMYLPASNTLAWSNNGSETMRLDSAGNLGLGVTPSAWYVASANARTFQINYAGFYADTGNSVFLSSNYLFGTSGSETFIASGYANKFLINSGQFRWLTSTASGSAGGAATMTQAMTLDASGNLGTNGQTSPGTFQNAGITIGTGNTNYGVNIYSSSSALGDICFAKASSGSGLYNGMLRYSHASDAMSFWTVSTERARIDSSGNFIQKGATTASGIKPSAIGNSEGITTVNSTTYTVTLGTSAKLFWISLGNGDAALVFTSYLSSSITFLGITPTNIVASASPTSAQLGISKSANSHDIVIKTGSALASTAAAWQMGVLSSGVS